MISLDKLKMEQEAIQHKWYVVRVKGGQEKKISTYIEKEVNRLNWNEFVTQVLVPTEKVYQMRNGKKGGEYNIRIWEGTKRLAKKRIIRKGEGSIW